jgi:hypothetical protein
MSLDISFGWVSITIKMPFFADIQKHDNEKKFSHKIQEVQKG